MSDDLNVRIVTRSSGFSSAVDSLAFVADRLAKGQQFNAYDDAENDDFTADEDCEMLVCLGPFGDARLICRVTGRAQANMIADALTLAATTRAISKEAADV